MMQTVVKKQECRCYYTRTPEPFLQSSFPAGQPQPVLVPGVIPAQGQMRASPWEAARRTSQGFNG